jgi:CYTH domain-containing protein
MHPRHKYARIEWERRFLLHHFPRNTNVTGTRRVLDRYIDGTNLRLRKQDDGKGQTTFKLTQKLRERTLRGQEGLITTIYLTEGEYGVLAKLPAKTLTKSRFSVPPFGIDIFEENLSGLILAEAEFNSAAEASALTIPPFIVQEVSDDVRFTGGRLVAASRQELQTWLEEHGIRLNPL